SDEHRYEGGLLPDEGDDDAAPVEEAHRLQGSDDANADQHVVHEAVLGEKGAHNLADHDERDEQRPAIEPAQERDRARIFAEHKIAADHDRQQTDDRRRKRDNDNSEDDVGRVEFEGLDEIAEAKAVLDREGADHGTGQRNHEQQNDD